MRVLRWCGGVAIVLIAAAVAASWAPVAFGQAERATRMGRAHAGGRMAFWGEGGRIGASVRDLESADRERLGGASGALIEDVQSDSPAEKAGLKKDDVLVEFDGERVRSARQLIRLVRETPEGRAVNAAVLRDGQRVDLTLTPEAGHGTFTFDADELKDSVKSLGELGRDFAYEFEPPFGGSLLSRQRLGVTVEEMTPQLAAYFGAKDGVLVSSVADDSPASKAGLKVGDVLRSVNGRAVGSRGELVRALHELEGREVTLEIVRDRKATTLKATLEDSRTTRRARITRAI